MLIAINEPPDPSLVEPWAPEAERRAEAELYASYGGESYPTTPRKMFDCEVKSFAFEAGLRHDGRTVAELATLSPKQLNCILGLASKYVRIEFLDHKH
jgi:hypothetical protein